MPSSRATIRDVAAQAGVSVATVSKVLNARYGVSAATHERVQRVIDELGYQSSIVASSLRSHRTGVLGVLVADLEPFSTELLKGIATAVRGTGYELVIYSAGGRSGDRVGWERRYLSRLGGTLIDAAVLVTPTTVDADNALPVVAVDPHAGAASVPTVSADNTRGARLAVDHLLGLGHRRIAFISGWPGLESTRLRQEGFRSSLEAAGVTPDPALVVEGDATQERAHTLARALLRLDDPPTAVFAGNDMAALGVLAAARELGVAVPAQLSVVGFDNVPEAVMASPALTTVEQPMQAMGEQALRMLLELLGGGTPASRVVLDTRLVVRHSTAPPPPEVAARP
ncbi:transcriptional regulator, LacI family [Friedmanniella luteola]|uniref:Transcriptional regulator, LacI family n=1 Tax=Friedmanniella luteola TaxID=546871 RepID=A0A1H1Z4P0_9ACTN|nr:LacI family DNA-binding transcriptional regulator [Friedmanniella luteola]SDT28711.1 transcriptional regulator, LacI family [Friedmanniella luteola]